MRSPVRGPQIELWNLHDGVPAYADAQRIFNVLGRLQDPAAFAALRYRLNDGPVTPVHFKASPNEGGRLARLGDFNIDTIDTAQLQNHNRLALMARHKNGAEVTHSVEFPVLSSPVKKTHRLNLNGAELPQQIGQIIDGRWQVSEDRNGQACLEIREDDAGLDRIILLSTNTLDTGYRIRARLAITAWTGSPYNVGLVFMWNPHLQGDGTSLPGQWSTGLGYYYSHCRGLRIRYGVDVHLDQFGKKIGDHILGEKCFSLGRYWRSRLLEKARLTAAPQPQLIPGSTYLFDLVIRDDIHALTVWRESGRQPPPQIVVHNPARPLSAGAAGIIAHRCALRIYDFEISSA